MFGTGPYCRREAVPAFFRDTVSGRVQALHNERIPEIAQNPAMPDIGSDSSYFTKAVTELGERRPVFTTQAIFNERGIKVIDKGKPVNSGLYERLMEHRLTVPLEHSVSSLPTVNGALLRTHAERALAEVPYLARITSDGKTRALLLDSIEKLPLPDPIAFQLLLALEVHPDLFRHSILAALLAAWLTHGPLVSRYDIGMAAAAGLLHDIGMLHLDPDLLQPEVSIGRDQRRQLYSHPLVAATLIERHHEYPREVLRAVQEHHEFLDGSGYPRHLSGAAISRLGRVLALAELVSAMLQPGHSTSEMRLSVQLRLNKHRYDMSLAVRVCHTLIVQDEVTGTSTSLVAQPADRLLELNAVASDWPAEYVRSMGLDASRREAMDAVAEQAGQLLRTLAMVGGAPEQLEQLTGEAMDEKLQLELSLLAQEAAWQLRNLARQTRRRWRREPGADYPPALQAWLDRADRLVGDIQSQGGSAAEGSTNGAKM